MVLLTKSWRQILATIFFTFALSISLSTANSQDGPGFYLAQADAALSQGMMEDALTLYQKGIDVMDAEEDSLETCISLYTNQGTAFSETNQQEAAVASYEKAIAIYKDNIDDIVDQTIQKNCKSIAAQSAFFLGMTLQDLRQVRDAVDAYRLAYQLDNLHWAAVANLGSILHDELNDHERALSAYNTAYNILTDTSETPTDPPAEPKFVLSQLQYRIGICISHDPQRKCALQESPDAPVDCRELAAHAFSLALHFDPTNENAKHMLATTTADASMKRASNQYVKELFDDYATNFEHSLVQELQYNGFERLRRGFDRAMSEVDKSNHVFAKTVDAGCGTGLVGEQFRNVTKTLLGVDLSQAILDEAEKARPGLYNQLIAGDLLEILHQNANSVDLIVAADSYIYFGDLQPLFAAMEDGLEEDGYVAFTLENVDVETAEQLDASKPDWRWQLTASGRFAHRKECKCIIKLS